MQPAIPTAKQAEHARKLFDKGHEVTRVKPLSK